MVKNVFLMLALACIPSLLSAQTIMREIKKDSARTAPPAVRTQRDTMPTRTIAPPGRDTSAERAALSPRRDTVVMRWNEDSLIAARTATEDTVIRAKKSTTIAMLASMVLPGAGQLYNQSYWKAPVVWGFGIYFYSAYKTQNDKFKSYRDRYAASLYADTAYHQGSDQLKSNMYFYKSDRDRFGWYIAITYLIQLVDAYVDASLFNFEVSPDLQPHGEFKATLHIRLR